jgi:hypothetical protein
VISAHRDFTVNDIPWASTPVERLEETPLLSLSADEMFGYAESLQVEATWLRRLLFEALTALAAQTDLSRRQSLRIEALCDELRRLRGGRR